MGGAEGGGSDGGGELGWEHGGPEPALPAPPSPLPPPPEPVVRAGKALCTAEPTPEFWAYYRDYKDVLKKQGISVSKLMVGPSSWNSPLSTYCW